MSVPTRPGAGITEDSNQEFCITLSYKKINPKRAARIAAKEARVAKLSTASQEALARQRDDLKKTASANKKREKDEHEKYVRSVRRAKAKEKHKGH
ncbi:DUF2992 family protein [Propionibacterium acidifaciens]|uniref:DUF2992 family protein n=1 Tax=Propionibacterium acidifaciens TaxID=556499 RepID=UPI00138B0463|nr:DUF2992 family protein [Propionibacterium acidifaciens]